MKMADTDNERLFITCVDSLRNMNISSLQLDDMKNKAKLLLEVSFDSHKSKFLSIRKIYIYLSYYTANIF